MSFKKVLILGLICCEIVKSMGDDMKSRWAASSMHGGMASSVSWCSAPQRP